MKPNSVKKNKKLPGNTNYVSPVLMNDHQKILILPVRNVPQRLEKRINQRSPEEQQHSDPQKAPLVFPSSCVSSD